MLVHSLVNFFRCPEGCAVVDEALLHRLVETFAADRRYPASVSSFASQNDFDQVIEYLRMETYADEFRPHRQRRRGVARLVSSLYYFFRPWLSVGVRKYLQRFRLRGWERVKFPTWPLDTSVDKLHREAMVLAVQHAGEPIPFVWFWPDGRSACALLTHDVEAVEGLALVPALMDTDEQYGFRSAFQLVPEGRYHVPSCLLDTIRERGFEANVHDLNHDGNLFRDYGTFESRAVLIRSYKERFRVRGFRSGALYRNPEWIEKLGFEYDMSIPNAALLDPQFGGCCTLFPFFLGRTLELPTTMTQDYSLFNILEQQNTDLWKAQLETVLENHGMANFIVHPDYIADSPEKNIYRDLLAHLAQLERERNLWVARPGEVNDWWRARRELKVVRRDGAWGIEGEHRDRARLAFARLQDGELQYSIPLARAEAAD